jgi:exonuclease SbcC
VEQLDEILAELKTKEEKLQDIQERLERSFPFIEETNDKLTRHQQQLNEVDKDIVLLSAQLEGKQQLAQEKQARLRQWIGEQGSALSVLNIIQSVQETLRTLRSKHQTFKSTNDQAQQVLQTATQEAATAKQASVSAEERLAQATLVWEEQRRNSMFMDASEVRAACISEVDRQIHAEKIQTHRELQQKLVVQLQRLDEQLEGQTFTEEALEACVQNLQMQLQLDEEAVRSKAKAERDVEELRRKAERWSVLEQNRVIQQSQIERLSQLQAVFRGNTFVEFIAEEQLIQVCRSASDRLSFLTKQRYALEVDSAGGFVIRDDGNGGVRRPVSTLSGGETFLTSLALALALSAQIQLQGKYPLQFFFLDEGFGTLDPELLDTVITALEKLHLDRLTVGIISHVPELRARLARKLVVTPAQQSGEGSVISIETL